MGIREKKFYILKRLYQNKFDDKFYNIYDICKEFSESVTKNESLKLVQSLIDEGLINASITKDGSAAEITLKGVEFFEDLQLHTYAPSDKINSQEREEIEKKLDDFLFELEKLKTGQKIIYDDLSNDLKDLKKLLNILGKKDFRQIFKGKLLDAGLGSLTSSVLELFIQTFRENKLLDI